MALVFLRSLLLVPFIFAAAQSSYAPTVLCIPGQCVEGYSNITLGATLSSPASPAPLHLLPGQYSSTTNPELLHNVLISSSSTLQPSAGFGNGSLSLPLSLSLQPGLAIFSERLYSGQTSFAALPTTPPNENSSTPMDAQSMILSSNVVVIATTSSTRVILWDSIPDTANLPTPLNTAQLSLVDIQSTTCSPSCSSGGICNPQNGQCVCQGGFTGQACEDCASGNFGPQCQKCPNNCAQCDDGISGTGRCLKPSNSTGCNCQSGVCNSDGSCQCNPGFTKADNGTQCAKCADGFFQTTTGDCKVCQVGCNQCADNTGVCLSCKSGFSQDQSDQTKCDPATQVTSTGTQCPQLAFANGGSCQPCASPCQSCTSGTSNDCTACVEGQYMLNGVCVTANGDGICEGTNLMADNNKKACDSCGANCTSCQIPDFSIASLASQAQCTGCIPGSFLSNGTCVDSCPSGTFVSPQDNMTCDPCDSSCSTCSGSSTFCLTCSSSNQLSSNGQCVAASSCPQNTFANPSTGSCLTCHPDCATCSGSSFNQCSTCPPDRPVLTSGRCLPTCSKNQFLDTTSNSCQTCDSTCGSCSGSGSSSCLSCSNNNDLVLRSGSCVASSSACNIGGNTNSNLTSVINPLGACFSELITLNPSSTSSLPPLPSVSGIDQPTTIIKGRRLEWWEILLMALGCAFIFVVVIWCCRRRKMKKREEERKKVHAYAFASTTSSSKKSPWWRCGGKRDKTGSQAYHPDLDHGDEEIIHTGAVPTKDKNSWKWRLIRFGEKFFGHSKSTRVYANTPPSSHAMGPTARGKPTSVMLADSRPYGSPISPASDTTSDTKVHHHHYHHYHSHSQSKTTLLSNAFRDSSDGTERLAREDSPRPTRPSQSARNDDHDLLLLDVPIDVRSSEYVGSDLDKHTRHRDSPPSRRRGSPARAHPRYSSSATVEEAEEEEEGEEQDMVQLISSYNTKTPPATRTNFIRHGSRSCTPTPSLPTNGSKTHLLDRDHTREMSGGEHGHNGGYRDDDNDHDNNTYNRHSQTSSISTESMYSQMTGHARRMPNARQPVRDGDDAAIPPVPVLKSKFSTSTIAATDAARRKSNGILGHNLKLKKKLHGDCGNSSGSEGSSGLFWK